MIGLADDPDTLYGVRVPTVQINIPVFRLGFYLDSRFVGRTYISVYYPRNNFFVVSWMMSV